MSVTCPFCHGPAVHEFQTHDVNRQVTTEQFSYFRCQPCGLLFLSPVPENLGSYYPDEYYDAIPWSRQRLDRIESGFIELKEYVRKLTKKRSTK